MLYAPFAQKRKYNTLYYKKMASHKSASYGRIK